jgi:hypothetical protein
VERIEGGGMKIEKLKNTVAPIIGIYGEPGVGKTTLASKFVKSIWMAVERGIPAGVVVDVIDGLLTFANVLDALRELCRDPQGYQTLVIDCLDALEPLLIEHLCGQRGWKDIESPSFGKGYVALDDVWRSFLKGVVTLRDRHNVTIVLIAHSTIEPVDDPRAPSFSTFVPKLHKRGRHLVVDCCDVVGFLGHELKIFTDDQGFKERVRATASSQRFLFVEGTPAYTAKNRYGMPTRIPVGIDLNINELTKYWKGEPNG